MKLDSHSDAKLKRVAVYRECYTKQERRSFHNVVMLLTKQNAKLYRLGDYRNPILAPHRRGLIHILDLV